MKDRCRVLGKMHRRCRTQWTNEYSQVQNHEGIQLRYRQNQLWRGQDNSISNSGSGSEGKENFGGRWDKGILLNLQQVEKWGCHPEVRPWMSFLWKSSSSPKNSSNLPWNWWQCSWRCAVISLANECWQRASSDRFNGFVYSLTTQLSLLCENSVEKLTDSYFLTLALNEYLEQTVSSQRGVY